ncbi:MAG: helix-turn-helix domain-containing protein [Candidatus Galacturonibacter soehngenii]|nr:helix-turn-helix domain-containing protein [Candidatus Galacturonibacter soehngenii]
MKKQDIIKTMMNPVRLRIIQYLILHGTGTTAQIKEELTDIPPASLYRHIKALEEAKVIMIVKENKIRGVIERVYQMNMESPIGDNPTNASINQVIQAGLISLMSEFSRYLEYEENDPQKDMLFLTTSTLLLSDEEFTAFTKEIGEVFNKVIHNKKNEARKVRRITWISSPCEE